MPEGTCRCRRSEHRRRPACAPAPSNACAPVSARASRPSKSLAIKAVRLAPFDFFDCFSKRAHLRRPGRANPLDPSADQGSVDRQGSWRESGVSRHARAGPHARRAGAPARARARGRRGSVELGRCAGGPRSVLAMSGFVRFSSRRSPTSRLVKRSFLLSAPLSSRYHCLICFGGIES